MEDQRQGECLLIVCFSSQINELMPWMPLHSTLSCSFRPAARASPSTSRTDRARRASTVQQVCPAAYLLYNHQNLSCSRPSCLVAVWNLCRLSFVLTRPGPMLRRPCVASRDDVATTTLQRLTILTRHLGSLALVRQPATQQLARASTHARMATSPRWKELLEGMLTNEDNKGYPDTSAPRLFLTQLLLTADCFVHRKRGAGDVHERRLASSSLHRSPRHHGA